MIENLEDLFNITECRKCKRLGGGFFIEGIFFNPAPEIRKTLEEDKNIIIIRGYCTEYPYCKDGKTECKESLES